jgi:hypothetical protein
MATIVMSSTIEAHTRAKQIPKLCMLLNLQNCGLNEPLFFLNFPASVFYYSNKK